MGTKITNKLEFKNPDIFKHQSDFTGKEGKQLARVYTSFNMKKTTAFRGLCLCEYLKGEKHFVIRFTLRGQREKKRIFSLGKFDNNLDVVTGETKFGVKQCQERLFKIIKEHQDEYGKWIKDPNQTIVYNAVNITITIRKLIEQYAIKGFQKMENAESLVGNSIRDKVRHMFGYNLRIKHMEYDSKDNGDGYVRFKPNKKNNKPAPESWEQLFKWYPAGKFLVNDHYFNRTGAVSIYDDPISKINIEDLRSKLITNYIQQYTSHSARYDVIQCFRTLWAFAITEGYMETDVGINPTYRVPNKKGRLKPYKYRLKIFSDDDFKLLLKVCNDLSYRFPWQSDAIVLQALTGLRRQECFKLKKDHIDWENKEIIITPGVSKTGDEEFIPITKPIETCLRNIEDIANRHFTYRGKNKQKTFRNYPLSYAKHLPWLFCTTQVMSKKLLNKEYRESSKTRLRSDKHCWLEIRDEMKKRLGIPDTEDYLCSSKMLRKTFTHKCQTVFEGRSDISKRHTRHKSQEILEGTYDGNTRKEKHESAEKLAKVIDFVKRRAI